MWYGLWSSPIRLPGGWCLRLRQQSARCYGCGAGFRQSDSETFPLIFSKLFLYPRLEGGVYLNSDYREELQVARQLRSEEGGDNNVLSLPNSPVAPPGAWCGNSQIGG